MIRVTLPPEVQAEIRTKSAKRGVLNSKTMLGGKGNETGFAGEAALKILLKSRGVACTQIPDSRDFDFIVNGKKIDVKTRASGAMPCNNWDCKIPDYSLNVQKCDGYVFAVAHPSLAYVTILGYTSKEAFKAKAKALSADASGKQYNEPHSAVLVADLVDI
jgi:hypothetical protein